MAKKKYYIFECVNISDTTTDVVTNCFSSRSEMIKAATLFAEMRHKDVRVFMGNDKSPLPGELIAMIIYSENNCKIQYLPN